MISPRDFTDQGIDFFNCKTIDRVELPLFIKKCRPERGDVLYSRLGTIGKARLLDFDFEFVALHSIALLKPAPGILDSKWLLYLMQSPDIVAQARRGIKSIGTPDLGLQKINEFEVPLAPLPEQRQVVAKIEELFSDLDAGVAALERMRASLKRYRASVLKAAVEGRLTEEWRKRNPMQESGEELLERILVERRAKWEQEQLRKFKEAGKTAPKGWRERYGEPEPATTKATSGTPPGWCYASVDQLAAVGTGTTPARGVSKFYTNGTLPWVTSSAVNEPFVSEGSELVTQLALDETSLRLYPAHTLLVALYGEGQTRGKVTELMIPATINQALAALVLSGHAEKCRGYLKLFLAANYIRLRSQSAGGVQPNLNLGLVRQIALALPPSAEQSAIVAEVDRRLSVADAADQQVEHALRCAARLRQSILQRAFEGKLVRQDASEVPASEFPHQIALSERVLAVPHKSATTRSNRRREMVE